MPSDPWVSVRDHADPVGEIMIYGGGSTDKHIKKLKNNVGANVFICNLYEKINFRSMIYFV